MTKFKVSWFLYREASSLPGQPRVLGWSKSSIKFKVRHLCTHCDNFMTHTRPRQAQMRPSAGSWIVKCGVLCYIDGANGSAELKGLTKSSPVSSRANGSAMTRVGVRVPRPCRPWPELLSRYEEMTKFKVSWFLYREASSLPGQPQVLGWSISSIKFKVRHLCTHWDTTFDP